jgi:hypothetical protein
MRPLRFLITLATCVLGFFCLLFFNWGDNVQESVEERSGIGALLNWRTPSSLFPPSAIISLTDDNSTFFLARPAAFGPLLPSKSLSGQLWVGSGFGDDHLGRGGPGAGAEGELGCSDIPDWHDGEYSGNTGRARLGDFKTALAEAQESKGGKRKRATEDDDEEDVSVAEEPVADDGTDDHLHHPLPPSDGLKTNGEPAGNTKKPTHADIQSLQETAEIAGKVVLLSRGGCGFLEKVKWAQRRGAVALIVGDDIRGGPLVTMYARGDTSNVTIPALFTSHMTAHLLSSLIPSGRIVDGLSAENAARLGLALPENVDGKKDGKKVAVVEKPNFTTTSVAVKSTQNAKAEQKDGTAKNPATDEEESEEAHNRAGWFSSIFGRGGRGGREDSRRPPSSGSIGWVLQKEFEEEEDDTYVRVGNQAKTQTAGAARSTKAASHTPGDGFVIGVQDWRDPDMVAEQRERQQLGASASQSMSSVPSSSTGTVQHNGPKGGSITPGSGEYAKAYHDVVDALASGKQASVDAQTRVQDSKAQQKKSNWLARLFTQAKEPNPAEQKPTTKHAEMAARPPKTDEFHHHHQIVEGRPHHEGLWVTLTPTSMSSSPFFDTLLVLVVSPLVTLTVVYALLLLRSRIRRRRWRAPKSVVERLPVRTYQTMPSTTASSTTSSVSSPVSATTPLLPTGARAISARSRPRSRTESEVPVQASSSLSDELAPPSLEQIEEKRAAGLAEWRRRYGGKQRECVVCLEEYVDGVSRVMSLPCGHEFHAECM